MSQSLFVCTKLNSFKNRYLTQNILFNINHLFAYIFIWFQVFLCNTNNSISQSFVLHTVKWSNSSIYPIDGTLTGTITPGEGGLESNGNEGVL